MDSTQKAVGDPPFLRNVGLFLTYHCQASCAHCIVKAGPTRHEEVRLDDARDWIRQIASYRNHHVYVLSLTGGEPFSNLTLLRRVMEFAAESNLYVSIATNGFWARERETAKQLLNSLPKICFVSISTDAYHQSYIPFEQVKNAIWAMNECGIPHYVSVVTEDERDDNYRRLKSELVQITAPDNIRLGITFPLGRASHLTSLRYTVSSDPPREACQAASSPCIFPDGSVYGCIGPLIDLEHEHPLLLGNLRKSTVAEVFDRAEVNAVLHALRLWGPAKLIRMLAKDGLGEHLPKSYIAGSVCNACYSMMSEPVLRNWVRRAEQDVTFRRNVAYGRVYYLSESRMVELGC